MNLFKTILIFVAIFIGATALVWGFGIFTLEYKRFFAPKKEEIRREVFENTRSFNEAKLQELVKYRLEYMRSDSEQDKAAIAATVRITFAAYDASKLPQELKSFLNDVQYK